MASSPDLIRWTPDLTGRYQSPDMIFEELMRAIELRLGSGLVERGAEMEAKEWDGSFSGFATTSDPDHDAWIVATGAARDGMGLYMRNPIGLWNHDPFYPVFGTKGFEERDPGLHIHAGMDLPDPFAAAKAGQLRRGIVRGLSIGFLPKEEPKILDGHLVFSKVQILEISLVSIPANPHALIDKKAADRIERYQRTGMPRPAFELEPEPERPLDFADDIRLRRIVAEMIDERIETLRQKRAIREAVEALSGAV
jgi:HK97 family phage prohead protease